MQVNKTIHTLLAVSIALGMMLFYAKANDVEADSLINISDYITSDLVNEPNVTHNIEFNIPLTGHSLLPSEYIRITFPNYANLTIPTSGSGWTGTPSYSVNANTVLITNISIPAGQQVRFSGITATNPPSSSQFEVYIETSNDALGTIVFDDGSVIASTISGVSTASVTIPSNNSSLELTGYTSPGAFVTILLDNVVAGTTIADSSGNFSKSLSALNSNTNYVITIFAQDTELRQSRAVEFSILTLPYTNHQVSNIVIPPTFELDKEVYTKGENILVNGLSHPGSNIVLFIGTTPQTYTVNIVSDNSSGLWTYQFSTANDIALGSHIAYAKEYAIGGYESIFTQTIDFIIIAEDPPIEEEIDNSITPPVVSSAQAADNVWTNQNTITLTWTTPKNAIGYNFILTSNPNQHVKKDFVTGNTSKTYYSLTDGIYYFRIVAFNGSKWSSEVTYILKVDATAPEIIDVQITPSDLNKIDRLPIFTFSAKDAMSGIKTYLFSIDGSEPIPITNPYQMSELFSGSHVIELIVEDNAGNISKQQLNIKVVDVEPPIIINPEENEVIIIGGQVIITGKALPNVDVKIFIDNEYVGTTRSDEQGRFEFIYDKYLGIGKHFVKAHAINSNGISGYYSSDRHFIVGVQLPFTGKTNTLLLYCCCLLLILLIILFILILKKRKQRKKDKNK